MAITSLDIRRKEFKRSVRGYADEEVDIFLDEVADEFERLSKESVALQERLARLEEQMSAHLQVRDALEKTLVLAQVQADETRANARREADTVLREAERKAQSVVTDSYAQVSQVQQSLVQLRYLEEDFRSKFRLLLEGHLGLLAEEPLSATSEHVMSATLTDARAAAPPAAPVVAPAAAPVAPVAVPEPVPVDDTRSNFPYEIPAGLGAVPEFPAVPPTARVELPVPPKPVFDVPAAIVPGPIPSPAVPAAAVVAPAPAAVAWGDTQEVTATDDTGTATDPTSELARFGITEAQIRAIGDPVLAMERDLQVPVSDDSITREEDPLRNFFFGTAHDRTAEDFLNDGKGTKDRPRDFEW